MMPAKPVAYDSLKILLQYLEPNRRIELSIRSPSLRATEKLVPLRINNLSLHKRKTIINNTTYFIGLLRKFPPGEEILEMKDESPQGVDHDYDQFGFIDHQTENVILRGDVDLRYWFGDQSEFEDAKIMEQQESLERDLEEYEKNLRHLSLPRIRTTKKLTVTERQQEIANVKEKISHIRRELKRYYCRRDRVPFDYTRLIQLSILTPNSQRKEFSTYNRTLPEAMRYLQSILFGGRSCPVEVNTLEINGAHQILRFPESFKINVKNIKTEIIPFGSFDHIINPENYSSTNLIVKYTGILNEGDYDQPAITNAKSLLIIRLPVLPEFCSRLQAKCVMLPMVPKRYDYAGHVKYWLEHGKSIGSIYTFSIEKEEAVKENMGKIKSVNEELLTGDQKGSLTFSMPTPNTQLRVYCEKYCPCRNVFQEYAVFGWILVFAVETV